MRTKNIVKLYNRKIGIEYEPFIIAEMSGNHNQSLENALKIVEEAANAGVNAIKLQTYTADTMTININKKEFKITDPESLWFGKSLYQLYQEAHTPWEWHKPIFDLARELNIIPFSTPFDDTSVDFLESLNTPFYKIASFENTDIQLIRRVSKTGKPIIVSIGMANISEIEETINTIREIGGNNVILLKCTSSYPSSPQNSNLKTIPDLKSNFNCEVGLSDHTLGIGAAIASIAYGATVIEKHLTLRRSDGGVDSSFSLEPKEMKILVDESKRAWQATGRVHYGVLQEEKSSLLFRRSLYVVKDIKIGQKFSRNNVRAIRPGYGLPTKYLDNILGKICHSNIQKGTPLNWEHIK